MQQGGVWDACEGVMLWSSAADTRACCSSLARPVRQDRGQLRLHRWGVWRALVRTAAQTAFCSVCTVWCGCVQTTCLTCSFSHRRLFVSALLDAAALIMWWNSSSLVSPKIWNTQAETKILTLDLRGHKFDRKHRINQKRWRLVLHVERKKERKKEF